jgi:hypothetical protein
MYMRNFLILLPLTEEHQDLHDRVLATAKAFFETVAPAERRDIGLFQRSPKPNRPLEILPLVVVRSRADASADRDIERGRALEAVLRATLGAAGITSSDVRVFVDSCENTTASQQVRNVEHDNAIE